MSNIELNELILNERYRNKLITEGRISFTDGIYVIAGTVFREPIEMANQVTLKSHPYLFSSCVFETNFSLQHFGGATSVGFKDCHFKEKAHFTLAHTPVRIGEDCRFENIIDICGDRHETFTLKGIELMTELRISGTFNKTLAISTINLKNGIGNVQGKITIQGVKCSHVLITDVFVSEFDVIHRNEFEFEAIFQSVVCSNFQVNDIYIGLFFQLTSCTIDKLTIDNTDGRKDVRLYDCTIKSFNLLLSQIANALIIKSDFLLLHLSGKLSKDCLCDIKTAEVLNLTFLQVFNEGHIALTDVKLLQNGQLSIVDSDLSNTNFILCKFSKAIFVFENSKLTEAFFSETDFARKVHSNGSISYSQAQLVFGQLSTAFGKQGDTVRQIEYHAREIESHYYNIRWSSRDFFVKLNLLLNFVSTNFGRRWIQGFFFTVGVGLIFFYALVVSTNEVELGLGFLYDQRFFPSFLKFMNPLRLFEAEKIFTDDFKRQYLTLTDWSLFWDFWGRVFLAYGFYQTIQAFRRLGKT